MSDPVTTFVLGAICSALLTGSAGVFLTYRWLRKYRPLLKIRYDNIPMETLVAWAEEGLDLNSIRWIGDGAFAMRNAIGHEVTRRLYGQTITEAQRLETEIDPVIEEFTKKLVQLGLGIRTEINLPGDYGRLIFYGNEKDSRKRILRIGFTLPDPLLAAPLDDKVKAAAHLPRLLKKHVREHRKLKQKASNAKKLLNEACTALETTDNDAT